MTDWQLAMAITASVIPIAAMGAAVYYYDLRRRVDTESQESSQERRQEQPSPMIRLARDVAVNVAANLIAAAIIYLVAAVVGILPRNPYLILSALVVASAGISCALFAVSLILRGRAKAYFIALSLLLLGIAEIVVPLVNESGLSLLEKMLYPIGGIAGIGVAVAGLIALRVRKAGPED